MKFQILTSLCWFLILNLLSVFHPVKKQYSEIFLFVCFIFLVLTKEKQDWFFSHIEMLGVDLEGICMQVC